MLTTGVALFFTVHLFELSISFMFLSHIEVDKEGLLEGHFSPCLPTTSYSEVSTTLHNTEEPQESLSWVWALRLPGLADLGRM